MCAPTNGLHRGLFFFAAGISARSKVIAIRLCGVLNFPEGVIPGELSVEKVKMPCEVQEYVTQLAKSAWSRCGSVL